MNEEHILASPLGRKGFSILLLQDLAVIPILLLVGVLGQSSAGESAVPWYLAVLAVIAVLAFSRYGLNQVLGIVANTRNREVMTAASLLIVIGVAVLMDVVGLSMGLGRSWPGSCWPIPTIAISSSRISSPSKAFFWGCFSLPWA